MSIQPHILFSPELLMSDDEWGQAQRMGGPGAKFRTGFSVELQTGKGRYIWHRRGQQLFYMLDAKQIQIPHALAENIKNFLASQYNCWAFGPRAIPVGSDALHLYEALKQRVDSKPLQAFTYMNEFYTSIDKKIIDGSINLQQEYKVQFIDNSEILRYKLLEGSFIEPRRSQVLRQEIVDMDKDLF